MLNLIYLYFCIFFCFYAAIPSTAGMDLLIDSNLSFETQAHEAFCEIHLNIKSCVNLEEAQITFVQNPAFMIPQHVIFIKNLMYVL